MVLYKLGTATKILNIKTALFTRMKQFYDRAIRFDMATPASTTLYKPTSSSSVRNWTLITDTIFGGKSDCELSKTTGGTCLFKGQLHTLTNGRKVLPSFARMWFVYPMFHLDLSDYESGGIKIRYQTDRPEDFQFHFEFNHFVDDVFFYAPITPERDYSYQAQGGGEDTIFFDGSKGYQTDKIRTYQETDQETGQVWTVSTIPFTSFYVNSMGDETRVSAIRKAKQTTSAQVFDIVSIGVGISSLREGPFSFELKSIEAFVDSEFSDIPHSSSQSSTTPPPVGVDSTQSIRSSIFSNQ